MKDKDLRASLGKIHPGEDLIEKTMTALEEQKHPVRRQTFRPAAWLRPAAAACACVLLLTVGILVGKNLPNAPDAAVPGESAGVSPLNLSPRTVPDPFAPSLPADETALRETLLREAGDGEWIIADAEVLSETLYAAEGEIAQVPLFSLLQLRLTKPGESSSGSVEEGKILTVLCIPSADGEWTARPTPGTNYRFYLRQTDTSGAPGASLSVYRCFTSETAGD